MPARLWPWLGLAVCALLGVARAPELLTSPRFWAEEGSYFYAAATDPAAGWLGGLAYIPRGLAGYWLLCASLPATLAAHWASVESAPGVTTLFSFALWLAPLAILLTGRSLVFDTPARKAVACALVIFAPSAIGEVWLNSINAQVYCGLTALVLLCEDLAVASRRRLWVCGVLLAFCGLSGPYTSFLLFGFALKAWWERSPRSIAFFAVVAVTAAVQLTTFAWLLREDQVADNRFSQLHGVRSLGLALYAQGIVPLGLKPVVRTLGAWLGLDERLQQPDGGLDLLLLVGLGAGVAAFVGWGLFDRRPRSPRNLLFVSFVSLVVFTTLFSRGGAAYGRYAVLSGAALLFLLLSCIEAGEGRARWRSGLCAGLLALSLGVGVAGYRSDPAFRCAGCPNWESELRRWRADPDYRPRIWPSRSPRDGPQWRVVFGEPQGPSFGYASPEPSEPEG